MESTDLERCLHGRQISLKDALNMHLALVTSQARVFESEEQFVIYECQITKII